MIKSDWDLHLLHWLPGTSGNWCESLHRGNITTSKNQNTSPPLFLLLFQHINKNNSNWAQKSTYCARLHPEIIVSPLLCGSLASGHVTPETSSQPPAGFLPWSSAGQAPLIAFILPHPTFTFHHYWQNQMAQNPSREKKKKEKFSRKVWIVLFALTMELNEIMNMVIPVEGEELDPGQWGRAHLFGMHQPIRERGSEIIW